MRKTIIENVAAMIYMAASTEATAPAEAGAAVATEVKPEVVPEVVPEGKGSKGAVNPHLLAEIKEENTLISELLAAKAAIVVPSDTKSEEYLALVKKMSLDASAAGTAIKAARRKSCESWPIFEAMVPMQFDDAKGVLKIGDFCKGVWNLMLPEVKLEDPAKPSKFLAWNEARKCGNTAAMDIENVRNYIRNNGEKLYPQFFPEKPAAEVEAATKAAEELKPFAKAAREVGDILKLTYLPKTQYVALDDKGVPAPDAKPVTIADLLKDLLAEINVHLPKEEGEKEKVAKAAEIQNAGEVLTEEERKELEEFRAMKAAKEAKAAGKTSGEKSK